MDILLEKIGIIQNDETFAVANVLLSKGKIEKIDFTLSENFDTVAKRLQCRDKILMPGVIDPHVHMRDPGFSQKEDFHTGSLACLKGGVTTFLDMPNTNPATQDYKTLQIKRALAKEKSHVNYGFHFGTSIHKNSIEKQTASTKIFFNSTTGDMCVSDLDVIQYYYNQSSVISVHAEGDSVKLACDIHQGSLNKKLYICHVSSKKELDYALQARRDNPNIYIEVAPHHLYYSNEDNIDHTLIYMKPSLKSSRDRAYLLEKLQMGEIDAIGSDHAPHTRSDKEKTAFGVPGVQDLLLLVLNLVSDKILSYHQVQKLTSENIATIFSIKNKGQIKEGYDADLVIVEKKNGVISNSTVESKCGWTPYHGKEITHEVFATIVNGDIGYIQGKLNHEIKGKEVCYHE